MIDNIGKRKPCRYIAGTGQRGKKDRLLYTIAISPLQRPVRRVMLGKVEQ